GVCGGLPVTQVIVRSSANVQSGGQSKLSTILHGLLLLVLVLAIPGWLNQIPLAVLASVLIITGYKLAKPALFADMYRRGPEQFVPFLATILGVVFTDLLVGIGIGMGIAVLTLLYRNYLNSHAVHVEHGEANKVIRLSLCEEVSFLNKNAIMQALDSIPERATVMLDASRCYVLDNDVAETLREFVAEAHHRNIDVQVICSESPLVKPRLGNRADIAA
ncbi:MAG TPA: SulP family inorganic anion transporter, partial [Hyphomicrobiales bacterium]|nr:SulP family inorganic anion transporter [Hyphomicrobiales bacterium]